MTPSERNASLLRRAERPLAAPEDDAALVSGIGEALGRGQLDVAALRSLRVALADHAPRDPAHEASLRTLRTVLRSAEASRLGVERQQEAEAALRHVLKGKILRALQARPRGPKELADAIGYDPAAVSRALKELEAADLVCPLETRGDGRVRPRELTAHAHQALHREAGTAPQVPLPELVQAIVDVALGTIADVKALEQIAWPNLDALARRHGASRELAQTVLAAVARSGERMGLVDDDEKALHWGATAGLQAQLPAIVAAHPEQWDAALDEAIGVQPYAMVVRDVDIWRSALREVRRPPMDFARPSTVLPDLARVFDDVTLARRLVVPGLTALAAVARTSDAFHLVTP